MHHFSANRIRSSLRFVRDKFYSCWDAGLYEYCRDGLFVSLSGEYWCRVANVNDVNCIANVYNYFFNGTRYGQEQMRQIVIKMFNSCDRCYISGFGCKVTTVIFVRNVSGWFNEPCYELLKVATHPDYRGLGLVGLVIRKIIIDYPDARLFARIGENNTSSIRAFEKSGFIYLGVIRTCIFLGLSRVKLLTGITRTAGLS